jgi:hypothetical protein
MGLFFSQALVSEEDLAICFIMILKKLHNTCGTNGAAWRQKLATESV